MELKKEVGRRARFIGASRARAGVLPRGLQGLHALGASGLLMPEASKAWHLAKSPKTYNKWRVNIGPSPAWQIM